MTFTMIPKGPVARGLSLLRHVDFLLLSCTFILSLVGIAMVYVVTKPSAALLGVSPHYYLIRQCIFAAAGFLALIIIISLDYRFFEEFWPAIYIVMILSLIAVFGTPRRLGSQRWFQLGSIQLQPSEFAIIGIIICLSAYLARFDQKINFRVLLGALALVGLPMALIYKQPDLGTTIVVGAVSFGIFVFSGMKGRYLLALIFLLALFSFAVISLGVLHQYQIDRLTVFLHPNHASINEVYNLKQSEAAIGSGGIWGTGYGKGAQTNLAFVPEQQTDFIFTSVGEQLGFVGSCIVLGLYLLVIYRLVRATMVAKDAFGRLISAGALLMLSFSVFENTGMTVGIMPIAGIPLPFMSYGGSAMICFWAAIGLSLSVEMRRFSLKPKRL
jgi:rod shape determining protein RodA